MASVQRDQGRGSDEGDKDGERGEGGRKSTSVAYVRGLFSSVRVWLGINSVPLEVIFGVCFVCFVLCVLFLFLHWFRLCS